MKKINLFLIFTFFFLNACGTFSEVGKVLRNEKTTSADEFLIQKKEPLSQPPNFSELPKPGKEKKNENDNDIFNMSEAKEETINESTDSSVEESILDKIRN